jgi:formate hydrogenlyase subunit 3/multisubunit Na+/H+ antiporter MnhD subunit
MPTSPLFLLVLSPTLYLSGALVAVVLSARPAAARIVAALAALAGAATGLALALPVLLGEPAYGATLGEVLPGLSVGLRLDGLSAWFVLILSAVALPVAVAGAAYTRAYDQHGGPRLAAATNVFLAAMLLVLLADGIYGFLLGWELMALASYLLVVHEHTTAGVRQAGFFYLGMTHVGTAFLVVALLVLRTTGGAWDFATLRQAALEPRVRDLVFVLALVGCGTKAGLIPLHVWLPRAHPVAPSHVSALMSGVMLKVGIYGLLRLTWDVLGGGPIWWGGLLLGFGLVSAVLGVLYALMEHDLKRLLAFHSIENVGIILIGLGAGLLLAALGQPAAAALALGAGLFHALNHALFKALLFLGAGAVQQATGTRDLGPTPLVATPVTNGGNRGQDAIGSAASVMIGPDGTLYVGANNSNMYAVAPDGNMKWLYEAERELAGIWTTAALSADSSVVYFGANKGGVYALNARDGSLKWQFRLFGSVYSSLALDAAATLYTGSTAEHVYAINSANGEAIADFDAGAAVWTAPSIRPDGTVVVGTRSGRILVVG